MNPGSLKAMMESAGKPHISSLLYVFVVALTCVFKLFLAVPTQTTGLSAVKKIKHNDLICVKPLRRWCGTERYCTFT